MRVSARFGRFILPVGFAPLEVGSWTAKDLTRIQRLNAEANFGLMLALPRAETRLASRCFEAAVMGVLGDGNREKDYDWFYFADTDARHQQRADRGRQRARRGRTQRSICASPTRRASPDRKSSGLPSYWASKRNDDALVAGGKVQLHSWVSVFGEYARYVWGPTETSAEMLGIDPEPIDKPGYYVGGTFEVPVTARRARRRDHHPRGAVARRQPGQVPRLNGLYGVEMGKKDRGTIARVYVDVARLVTVGVFWADISNPYPWISGVWPVAGPRAFTGARPIGTGSR